jgi:ABC-type Na+ transport system ATPase subunit NatA
VCDMIGILNEGRLMVVSSPQQIVESMGVKDLEEAYLRIVGGKVEGRALLAWR